MKLLILTPARDEPRFASIADLWLGRLSAGLATAGIEVVARPWTDICEGLDDAEDFDGVAPLLAWGYHRQLDPWNAALNVLADCATPVVNPAQVLSLNTRKTYLANLEAAGVPIVPTLFVERLTPDAVAEAHARFGETIIAKPQISGGSHETVRLTPGASLDGAPTRQAMLQPFLPAVAEEGELSLLYFDGRFSHAVGKVARDGDFRVQYQYGGTYGAIDPPPGAQALAVQVLSAVGRPLTYARIDLIRDTAGELRLMELEAIEPDLYLEHAPDGGAGFGRAMAAAIG